MSSRLYICIFAPDSAVSESVTKWLKDDGVVESSDRHYLHIIESDTEFNHFIIENKEKIDCLVILYNDTSHHIINNLYEEGLLLPAVIIESPDYPIEEAEYQTDLTQEIPPKQNLSIIYHVGEIKIKPEQIKNITIHVDKAITQFLYLAPSCAVSEKQTSPPPKSEERQNFLLLQQRRLASKLKERLGYLGIYYNRNPEYFYRNLTPEERQECLGQLASQYREVIILYFGEENEVNQLIDQFVNQCFFADLSVSQILEIHMELMDEFAQQLKLEGRNEEVLLDYRLALIDIIAHLCEMYRRSIPREDLPFEVLFPVD
ncbi:circadian clock protein KaiA [Cyanobacterium stanieri LEGE 03274]|uniref:Circadian clock oscillator protein KaiA n=1 Tax=Cyanobacterium stanieri LEGE 03274 TaxID=1828756 RepID=A0ABR9V294_9CHRO|nr:circadian clock protein KaiA [Cyanobacterium stanieri]MBE9222013.1 circadian clock protein KaiA [Cyanobacterium stanieri LEGE 03274]